MFLTGLTPRPGSDGTRTGAWIALPVWKTGGVTCSHVPCHAKASKLRSEGENGMDTVQVPVEPGPEKRTPATLKCPRGRYDDLFHATGGSQMKLDVMRVDTQSACSNCIEWNQDSGQSWGRHFGGHSCSYVLPIARSAPFA